MCRNAWLGWKKLCSNVLLKLQTAGRRALKRWQQQGEVRDQLTLTGPNLDLLHEVCVATSRPVVTSGGVSRLDDLRATADLVVGGVVGAIVGEALCAGAFTLPEALAATQCTE